MKQLNHYETLEKMPSLDMDCIIYACGISTQNMGLILRSADIFGVKSIYYDNSNEFLDQKAILKISRNSKIPVFTVQNTNIIQELKKNGYNIIALEITDSSIPMRSVNFNKKICLIIGNERHGISQEILDLVDCACHIEMIGKNISSLNVAIATSIALYEISQFYLDKSDSDL